MQGVQGSDSTVASGTIRVDHGHGMSMQGVQGSEGMQGASAGGIVINQRHGKSRVRVARVWRNADGNGRDVIVEWKVAVSLFSNCQPAYTEADNSDIVATDTMKNTVYVKAKECYEVVSVEEFAILLAKHFTSFYPQVTGAVIDIIEKPWERVSIDGQPHHHGFKLGSESHTTQVTVDKSTGEMRVQSGIQNLALLKTTQSGFEGFFRDPYTILPETRERMLATDVTVSWSYRFRKPSDLSIKHFSFTNTYIEVKKSLLDTFYGCPKNGVYSPSVQNTLYLMAKDVLSKFTDVESVYLRMPNIHFLPVNLRKKDSQSLVLFADDVFVPTDEPHGTIEATLSRATSKL